MIVSTNIWSRSGIIMQISVLFLFSAFIQVLANLVYLPALARQWVLSNYNRSAPIPRYQDRFNKEYALPEFDLGGRFAYYLLQLFLISFFSYVIPLCVPLVLIVFCLHYFVDRVNLFYRSSMNEYFGLGTIRTMYKLMESSVLVFALGNSFWSGFLGVSAWRPLNVVALSIAVFYVAYIWLVPFSSEIKLICYHQDYERVSYQDCMKNNRFEQTYRIMNPATNLFHQGRANYVFDQATRTAAAMSGSYGQMGGVGAPDQLGGVGMGGGGVGGVGAMSPMNSSGYGGMGGGGVGGMGGMTPMNTSGFGGVGVGGGGVGAMTPMTSSGFGGQGNPGVNTSGLRTFA